MDKQRKPATSLVSRDSTDTTITQLERELDQCRQDQRFLIQEREQFDIFTQAVADHAFVLLDVEGHVIRWNRGAERLMGWAEEEILGQSFVFFFLPEDVALGFPEQELIEATEKGCVVEERWHLRSDGSRFWGSGSLSIVRDTNGIHVGFAKVMRDLTTWQNSNERLRDSEERLRLFMENVTDYAFLQVDARGLVSSWNTGAERTFGYQESEIVGSPVRNLYPPEEAARGDAEHDLSMARERDRFEDARWLVRKDGSRLFARWVTTPMYDGAGSLRGFAKVLREETERMRVEEQIRNTLAEKHALLQEIHHRVKNNLQVISSLLSIQAARLQNSEAKSILADTEGRIRTIASLHEALYSSRDLSSIEFAAYIRHVVESLMEFHEAKEKNIRAEFETADLVLNIIQAIPLGLILNELVTNCLKHGFPEGGPGTVTVQLSHVAENVPREGQGTTEGSAQLVVRDDGIGLPPYLNFRETSSMGIHLVNLLVRQLQGRAEVLTDSGTTIKVRFPLGENEGDVTHPGG